VMHGNEPLKKQPNTQIKMEQPRHSLAPHLDSFTESTSGLSPPKTSSGCLKGGGEQLVSGMCLPACLGMSRARRARSGCEGK